MPNDRAALIRMVEPSASVPCFNLDEVAIALPESVMATTDGIEEEFPNTTIIRLAGEGAALAEKIERWIKSGPDWEQRQTAYCPYRRRAVVPRDVIVPIERCSLKTPSAFVPTDALAGGYLASGGNPLTLGRCDCECPLSRFPTASASELWDIKVEAVEYRKPIARWFVTDEPEVIDYGAEATARYR